MTLFSITRFSAAWPILAVLALPLAACGGGDENDQRTASGEVLEGTISDSMIPLDTVTSQPPLEKTVPKEASSDAAQEPGEGDDEDAAAAAADGGAPVADEPVEAE